MAKSTHRIDTTLTDLTKKLEELEHKLTNLEVIPPNREATTQISELKNNQDSAIADLEKCMESEILRIKESNEAAIKSSQDFFVEHLTKTTAEFNA